MGIARYEKRVLAWLLDEILPFLVGVAVLTAIIVFLGGSLPWFYGCLIMFFVDYMSYIMINSLFSQTIRGITPGMLILGIGLIQPNGFRISAGECWFHAVLTGVVPMVFVNALYMLGVHTERSVFDRLCGTLSIDRRLQQ